MDLYIVRHGIAEIRGEGPDEMRRLTSKGVRKTTEVAEGLAKLECKVDRIASSPLPRADETARIMREVLCPDAPCDICDFLAPGATASELVLWLSKVEDKSVMIVGHNPDFEEIASSLLAGDQGMDIVLKKAAVCKIAFHGRAAKGKGQLHWLMQPGQLRLIGAS